MRSSEFKLERAAYFVCSSLDLEDSSKVTLSHQVIVLHLKQNFMIKFHRPAGIRKE